MRHQVRRPTPAQRREKRAAVDDPEVVMEAAAAFLAVRPRSTAETTRRLRHLGYRHELVDGVVERLVGLGYLDDAAFATAWVESRDRARPRGEGALRRELALKGVARRIVDAVLDERSAGPAEAPPDELAARALIERRRPALEREPDPRKRRQKGYALLARNGFDPTICASVSAELVRDAAEADDTIG